MPQAATSVCGLHFFVEKYGRGMEETSENRLFQGQNGIFPEKIKEKNTYSLDYSLINLYYIV